MVRVRAWPGVRRLDELRSAEIVDMDQVSRLLMELAADEEIFSPLIARIPSGTAGSRWLIRPEQGPRLRLAPVSWPARQLGPHSGWHWVLPGQAVAPMSAVILP
jgi:hypothetical protein